MTPGDHLVRRGETKLQADEPDELGVDEREQTRKAIGFSKAVGTGGTESLPSLKIPWPSRSPAGE
eukprot:CAMPEP_0119304952 /NCGR_PEP_ID=MMETSP1333-20130426/6062_1 /TAXON_ID=418940 /ORGANISM="Scyphosphaera apsteinii, Strain RCC1455" /LENGTH=64 /DNA_ID=CAMNT_0007307933 /DNA_START=183 /DNA_END=377 /DNA_ORIENTATION=+